MKLALAGEASRPTPYPHTNAKSLRCDERRRVALRYATPQELLDMAEYDPADLDRRFKQALGHVVETGRLRPSDLQIPILTDACFMQPLPGYEGGCYNPYTLGTACIFVPPSKGRGPNTQGDFNVNPKP